MRNFLTEEPSHNNNVVESISSICERPSTHSILLKKIEENKDSNIIIGYDAILCSNHIKKTNC